jgi:hypothetical protein
MIYMVFLLPKLEGIRTDRKVKEFLISVCSQHEKEVFLDPLTGCCAITEKELTATGEENVDLIHLSVLDTLANLTFTGLTRLMP